MRRKRQVFTPSYISIKNLFHYLAAGVMFFILLLIAGPFYGEQTWQGNAAMIRRGEFETAGFFAASNSFPLNTKILVKSLYNLRTTEVIVIQRLSEYYSVFLLLSEEAAYELGMGEDDVINVEVTVIDFGTGDAIGLPDDLPYNPDPDVFPLPTVPDETARVTPAPTPFPEDTPTPGPTEELPFEPTPEIFPGETLEPTPEPSPEITPEPTPEPFDVKLNRDPQKNLFLPPHEDEMYVLEDFLKPDDAMEDVYIPDPEIVSTDEFKGRAIDESITAPDHEDTDAEIASLEMSDPGVEKPSVEDKTNPEMIASGINIGDPDVPVIVEKEKPVPDPSNEVPDIVTYEIALDPEEPVLPGEKTPDLSNEAPDPWIYDSLEYAIVQEPDIPAKEEGIPDPSNEVPDAVEYDIAFDPKEPDIPEADIDMPDPSYEVPQAEDAAEIALEPREPDPPTDADRGKPDPSYELPDAEADVEIAMEPEEPDLPTDVDRGKPDPSYELPDVEEDVEIAMEPEEPDPPTDADRGKPDPSYELPDTEEDIEIAMEPEEPDPPTDADRGKPDPSYELPDTEEEKEIAYEPADPEPPDEDSKEPDDGETDIVDDVEFLPDDEDIIIIFEETGPKPPTGDDMIIEANGKEEIYIADLEKGRYFIQLAAYTEESPAVALEKRYSDIYPVKIYTITDRMLEIYKVMVGPLNKYESDTLLYRFKSLGFRDAFVKYNN